MKHESHGHDARHELHDAIEHRVQRIGGGDAAADLVQDVDVGLVVHVEVGPVG